MQEHTFSRFAYFDTNILSHLAKNKQLWSKLSEFLTQNDLTLAVSVQVAELSDAKSLHQSLTELFVSVPSALVKSWDVILNEEVKAHPQKRTETLLTYPLNAVIFEQDGIQKLQEFFSSKNLSDARKGAARSCAAIFEAPC